MRRRSRSSASFTHSPPHHQLRIPPSRTPTPLPLLQTPTRRRFPPSRRDLEWCVEEKGVDGAGDDSHFQSSLSIFLVQQNQRGYKVFWRGIEGFSGRTGYGEMEDVKRLVSDDLRRAISKSTSDLLLITCTSLIDHLLPSARFQQVVRELGDPEMGLRRKNAEIALQHKCVGNHHFSNGDYAQAARSYSQALRFSPVDCDGVGKNLLATIYGNRASSFQKLEHFEECVRDSSRAIDASPHYVKAWYRRGKANALLKNYGDAVRDLETAFNLQDSISEKRRIKEELDIVLNLFKNTIMSKNMKIHDNIETLGSTSCVGVEPCTAILECVSTETKGRGMMSSCDIFPSSMVHYEEPLAAVVLKSCRENHCHFCFTELGADIIFCLFCATPSYCSEHCREQADLEHRHECRGVNWPVILPSDAILAGRILANFVEKGGSFVSSKLIETSEFSHNYIHESPERKLELHIYSVVLLHCLNHYYGSRISFTGTSASQLIVLFSQIKVNCMAIVNLKSYECGAMKDAAGHCAVGSAYTFNMEQVRVGQAIYLTGRLFNHSCMPNIHAYFLSRKLFIRSTEFVQTGYPLELSYGPQIGQMDYSERQGLLEDQYSFKCQCVGCSVINLSDICIHAFRCSNPNCCGAILESDMIYNRKSEAACTHVPCSVSKEKRDVIKVVASILLEISRASSQIGRNHCLKCGLYHDLGVLRDLAENAMTDIRRLQNAIISGNANAVLLSDAMRALNQLRSVKHMYSKDVSQAEDIIAEAFCLIGDLRSALHHCKASIKVLKKLYHKNHIVIGNELVKLVSLKICLDDRKSTIHNIKQLETILSLYYGSHMTKIFPYLDGLRRQLYS